MLHCAQVDTYFKNTLKCYSHMERVDKTFGHHHVNGIKGVTLLVAWYHD